MYKRRIFGTRLHHIKNDNNVSSDIPFGTRQLKKNVINIKTTKTIKRQHPVNDIKNDNILKNNNVPNDISLEHDCTI